MLAIDQGGNYTTFTLTVVVRDTTPPVITAPNVTVEGNTRGGAFINYPATATDAVGPVTLTFSIPPGSLFPVGTTPVTVTATDGAGNSSSEDVHSDRARHDAAGVHVRESESHLSRQRVRTARPFQYARRRRLDIVGPMTIKYSKSVRLDVRDRQHDGHGDGDGQRRQLDAGDVQGHGSGHTPPEIKSVSAEPDDRGDQLVRRSVKYAAAVATDRSGP